MKIAVVSDTHGFFPEIPDCDLLLLGGDYCPRTKGQLWWFKDEFMPWLEDLSQRMHIIGVAGNHDLIFEQNPDALPKMPWTYLQDSGCEWGGFKLWGSPWQRRFYDWAFNLDEEELSKKWDLIPADTDILLLHGPPRGYGDYNPFTGENCGSPTLLHKIKEIQPKLVIAGHIHPGYGKYMIGDTVFFNCSLVNEQYEAVNKIQVIEL